MLAVVTIYSFCPLSPLRVTRELNWALLGKLVYASFVQLQSLGYLLFSSGCIAVLYAASWVNTHNSLLNNTAFWPFAGAGTGRGELIRFHTKESGSCLCILILRVYSFTVTPSGACTLNFIPVSLFTAFLRSTESALLNIVSPLMFISSLEVIQPLTVNVSINMRSIIVSAPIGNESWL